MGFAMPPGMTLEEMLQAMEREPEAKPVRKRARDAAGRLKADDPATPADEAWAES